MGVPTHAVTYTSGYVIHVLVTYTCTACQLYVMTEVDDLPCFIAFYKISNFPYTCMVWIMKVLIFLPKY